MDRQTGVEPAFASITLLNVRSVGGYWRIICWARVVGIEPTCTGFKAQAALHCIPQLFGGTITIKHRFSDERKFERPIVVPLIGPDPRNRTVTYSFSDYRAHQFTPDPDCFGTQGRTRTDISLLVRKTVNLSLHLGVGWSPGTRTQNNGFGDRYVANYTNDQLNSVVLTDGIEPSYSPCQSDVLPLNYVSIVIIVIGWYPAWVLIPSHRFEGPAATPAASRGIEIGASGEFRNLDLLGKSQPLCL